MRLGLWGLWLRAYGSDGGSKVSRFYRFQALLDDNLSFHLHQKKHLQPGMQKNRHGLVFRVRVF